MARSGVIYGPTGTYKTTAAKHFAHYIARKTGKATAFLSADGGGWGPCEPEIAVGMIDPYRIHPRGVPQTLRLVGRGYWPNKDGNFLPFDYERFGGLVVEGWTSIAVGLLRYLSENGVDIGGETRAKLGTFTAPIMVNGAQVDERFFSTTRGDYGEMPKQLNAFTLNVSSLPFDYVLFTALDRTGEDDNRATIGGPDIPGKASLYAAPQWVGDCIHAQDYETNVMVKLPPPGNPKGEKIDTELVQKVVRYHFVSHTDPVTGVRFHCKPRVVPEQIAGLYKEFPGGYFEPTPESGFDRYLETLDRLSVAQEGSDTLKGWREKMDAKLGRGAKSVGMTEVKAK